MILLGEVRVNAEEQMHIILAILCSPGMCWVKWTSDFIPHWTHNGNSKFLGCITNNIMYLYYLVKAGVCGGRMEKSIQWYLLADIWEVSAKTKMNGRPIKDLLDLNNEKYLNMVNIDLLWDLMVEIQTYLPNCWTWVSSVPQSPCIEREAGSLEGRTCNNIIHMYCDSFGLSQRHLQVIDQGKCTL